ncbi:hypothetical protein CI109_104921 [Kwoniella shandongensis]|uniref:Uncharacterized protein n=1 Tax=Kwoniella shandongensis TaxID=1734106 RepID=A0A5M6BR75_9TREE|nr:uncharacterized protein CI109_006293 [Kwoniella shandongensis]KAA5525394.1 hypothetical protein CI109_006293 [Kwoniella shandongensis]
MPTPPPTLRNAKLPSSSPSSARLRRIAPSPVKIPPPPHSTSPPRLCAAAGAGLAHSHSDLAALSASPFPKPAPASASPSRSRRLFPLEFEFVPLELLMHSYTSPEKTLFEVLESAKWGSTKSARVGADIEGRIPLLFDKTGEFGRLAYDMRRREMGVDVPDEVGTKSPCTEAQGSNEKLRWGGGKDKRKRHPSSSYSNGDSCHSVITNKRRSGSTLFSPQRYMAERYALPRPILVEFRTDVFSLQGRKEIRENERVEESTPRYNAVVRDKLDEGMGRLVREESVGTFGNGSPEGAEKPLPIGGDDHEGNISPPSTSTEQSREGGGCDEVWDEHEVEDDWSMMLSAYADEVETIDDDQSSTLRKDSLFSGTNTATTTTTTRGDFKVTLDLVDNGDIHSRDHDRLFVPPPHMRASFSTSSDGESCDSPYSESIVTPHLVSVSTYNRTDPNIDVIEKEVRLPVASIPISKRTSKMLMVDEGINDTPTPAQKVARKSMQVRNTVTGRVRAPTLDKALPSLPHIVGEDLSASREREATGQIKKIDPEKYEAKTRDETEDLVEKSLREVDRSMTVQLWVDQEGTRENRTSLKFIRSIKPSVFRQRELKSLRDATQWCESPTRPEMFQQSGCWEFGMEPKERDKWMFHHAALEGLPVLRRLTTNLDDKHDYLSKGATLQIREPGVYAVYGSEDRGRAEWKFEYLVQPRISRSGIEIPNEKIVVPLGLYVSPSFFNPDRALKTHLLNVFKKTLTPNIVSEKVRPPHLGKPPTPITPSFAATTITDRPGSGSGSKETTNIGGRTRSHTHSATATTATPHARSVSRTIGAIAKALTSSGTPSHTPTTATYPADTTSNHVGGSTTPTSAVHKFGTKGPSFGRQGSRGRTPPAETPAPGVTAGHQEVAEEKKEKGKTRRRAASLFSRSRPFTPPVNIIELHPVPVLVPPSRSTGGGLMVPPPATNGTSISLPLPIIANLTESSSSTPIRPGPKPLTSINHYPASVRTTQPRSSPIANLHPFLHPLPNTATTSLSRSASTATRPILVASDNMGSTNELSGGGGNVRSGLRGLMPAPRRPAMRKRPSTAEPRLGMR